MSTTQDTIDTLRSLSSDLAELETHADGFDLAQKINRTGAQLRIVASQVERGERGDAYGDTWITAGRRELARLRRLVEDETFASRADRRAAREVEL